VPLIITKYGDILGQWAVYDFEVSYSNNDAPQRRANEEDLKGNQPPRGLGRWWPRIFGWILISQEARQISRHLLRYNLGAYSSCSYATINVTVETVPLLTTTSTPAKQHEYRSCEEFFMERLQTDMNTKKVNKLRNSWLGNQITCSCMRKCKWPWFTFLIRISGTITFRAHNVPVGRTIHTSREG